jgi:hypothetical protein
LLKPTDAPVTTLQAEAQAARPAGTLSTPGRRDAVSLLTSYLVLLMAIPSSLVLGSFGQAGAPAALFATVLFLLYAAARAHPALGLFCGPQPVRTAAIVFGCAIIASYVAASQLPLSALQRNGADRGMLLLLGWLGVVLLAADGIDRTDRLEALLARLTLGAAALAAMSIVEFVTHVNLTQYISIPGLSVHVQPVDLMSRDGLSRVMATTAEPLELAAVLGMCLPLAIHQARFAPAERRFGAWLKAALIAGAMPLTVSRSAILALGMICIVLFPTWPRRDRWAGCLVAALAPALAWLAMPSLFAGFGTLFGQLGADQSSKSRGSALSSAAPFIAHHPWFGQGFETFFPQTYFFVDDQYVTSLIETGIVGTIAIFGLLAAGWFTARRVRRTAATTRFRDLGQSLAASMAAAAIFFASFDVLSFTIASGVCFLLLGCTAAAWRLSQAM